MKKHGHFLALLIVFFIFNFQTSSAQEDKPKEDFLGQYVPRGLTKTSDGLASGYILYSPPASASVYLMNRKGEVVHEWKGNYEIASPYLNDDGSITSLVIDLDFPVFNEGGEAGRIQKMSWDSKILWDFEYANEKHHAHHDIEVLPNGNVLAIAWEAKSYDEVIQAGRDPKLTPADGLWTSEIVEIQPTDKTHGKIVWEWHIFDHLIQDFDKEKDNYGDVAAHPELLDFSLGHKPENLISQDSLDVLIAMEREGRNATLGNRGSDVYHLNAVNYNEELDQIALSAYHLGEVFIIDHSTTTEEATGHSGGRWGKGGDFLYRWGNPKNYRQGDSTDQQTFNQHDVRWIKKGFPGEGNLTLFNNNIPLGRDSLNYSAIFELKPFEEKEGHYELMKNKRFGPEKPNWKYVAKDTMSFHAPYVSGAQRLKNGNTFINQGPKGRYFELTPEGEIVWEYLNPYRGNIHKPNGDPVLMRGWIYSSFRSNFITEDHPALKDKTLVPIDPQPQIFKLPPKEEEKAKK